MAWDLEVIWVGDKEENLPLRGWTANRQPSPSGKSPAGNQEILSRISRRVERMRTR
jgi:hypothetical protein